ncbi:ATP-binding protein [Sphingobacterium alkalisoli]|uniref:ATP-binding protein n=1 Tax=Sphingobacterium alkalisoli TaxID=1874115 RepID=A0A4U0H573_9SPHI|nr:ATP-binding protein [Sphingobacterium alkalisoli]TJY66736.1 ATP-binding protein [Sphingobacterium alkalisoli]GGH14517.1 ATPase [Sphingobacterium alkalisoli]
MKRDLYEKLLEWKVRKSHKPLIIRGARQVGKTWLMKHFGKTEYKSVAYVNMESNSVIRDLFTLDFNIDRILLGLQIETGISIDAETLIIFDEIQEAPEAITSLKYFHENAPQYDIICAGSLLGVALTRHTSFPVGKVEFLDLYPLRFSEFAAALGESALVTLLENPDWALITGFSSRYIDLLRQYYYVGGMPEAVTAFAENKNFQEVREIQKRILAAYEQDFSKHAPSSIVPRIRMLWNSIPAQLAKENKKFIYGIIRQGARAKDYELAIAWLIDCGLVHQVHNVTKPAIPLKAYEDFNSFKLFLVDVGLLSAMTDLDVRTLLEGQALFQEFKGALTEQYVLQELTARGDMSIYYWSLENSRAEIDFLIQKNGKIIPLEVKAEENLQAKSLRVYYNKYKPETAIRASMSNYRKEDWMTNMPLYALAIL